MRYEEFLGKLWQDLLPANAVEQLLLEDVAAAWWKLQMIDPLLIRQIRSRAEASARIYDAYVEEKRRYQADASSAELGLGQLLENGWECQQIILRVSEGKQGDEATGRLAAEKQGVKKDGFAVRLGTSSDALLRYANAWRRDFYRALAALLTLKSGG